MHKDTAINAIKKEIGRKYETQREAAESLGITDVYLCRVLAGKTRFIPKVLLDLAGLHMVATYNYLPLSRGKK